jgi:hypothetical protein
MANRTLLNARDLIKAERPEIRQNPDFPNPLLTRIINDAYKWTQIQLAHLGIKQWESTDSLTLSAGTIADKSTKTAPLATDCPGRLFDGRNAIKYIECSVIGGGGGSTDKGVAHYVDDDVFLEHLRNSYFAPTNYEPIFTRKGNLIHIAPSTIDTAVAYYYKAVTELSSDSDTFSIPENFEEYIIKRSLVEIDAINKKIQDKAEALNDLSKDIKDSFNAVEFAKADESDAMRLQ